MFKHLAVIFLCLSSLSTLGQTSSSNRYQVGTITAVIAHQNAPGETADNVARYEVSIKIASTSYVVLYTPPSGVNSVEYSVGMDRLFLVGSDTLTFNSPLSGKTEVPILRREALPQQKVLDWSKAPSQYFSMKQEHLTDTLDLTDDQRIKIKPILEQEAGEAGQFLWTSVIPAKEKLKRWEKLVAESDAKIKQFLSPTQVDKLLELRRQQKEELRTLVAEQKAGKQD